MRRGGEFFSTENGDAVQHSRVKKKESAMFNPKEEARPVGELRKLQGERLQSLVKRAYENVPFYRAKFEARGVKPRDIRGIEDIAKLPFKVF